MSIAINAYRAPYQATKGTKLSFSGQKKDERVSIFLQAARNIADKDTGDRTKIDEGAGFLMTELKKKVETGDKKKIFGAVKDSLIFNYENINKITNRANPRAIFDTIAIAVKHLGPGVWALQDKFNNIDMKFMENSSEGIWPELENPKIKRTVYVELTKDLTYENVMKKQ
jgi:hypothetical protein